MSSSFDLRKLLKARRNPWTDLGRKLPTGINMCRRQRQAEDKKQRLSGRWAEPRSEDGRRKPMMKGVGFVKFCGSRAKIISAGRSAQYALLSFYVRPRTH